MKKGVGIPLCEFPTEIVGYPHFSCFDQVNYNSSPLRLTPLTLLGHGAQNHKPIYLNCHVRVTSVFHYLSKPYPTIYPNRGGGDKKPVAESERKREEERDGARFHSVFETRFCRTRTGCLRRGAQTRKADSASSQTRGRNRPCPLWS